MHGREGKKKKKKREHYFWMTLPSCVDAPHSAIKDFYNLFVRTVRLERELLQLEPFQKLKNG